MINYCHGPSSLTSARPSSPRPATGSSVNDHGPSTTHEPRLETKHAYEVKQKRTCLQIGESGHVDVDNEQRQGTK
jgi:hypothetical protein